MARQNFLHTLRFLLWLTTFKATEYPNNKIEEFEDCISDRLEQMYEIDKILFTTVEVPKI